MNSVVLIGRLTRDPDVRYTQSDKPMAIARYTIAVDRRGQKQEGQSADFISCVAFGKGGEFAEKYLQKGMKIAVRGHIQTGSYTNREGQKVYTTEIVVDEHTFCESRQNSVQQARQEDIRQDQENQSPRYEQESFMDIPDDVEDGGLPFN